MKLTNEMKDNVINAVVRLALAERKEKLATKEDVIANKIYTILYPFEIQQKMNALPDTFFAQHSQVWVGVWRNRRWENINLGMKSSKKISAVDRNHFEAPCLRLEEEIPGDTELLSAIKDLVAMKECFDNDKQALRAKIKLLLAGVNTTKQLETEWPEGAVYYKSIIPTEKTVNLPAVRGIEITEMISKIK